MYEVDRILWAIEQGAPQASEQLLPLVYDELRRLAAQKLAHEAPGQMLQPSALVHEADLRLVDVEKAQCWDCCRHFFATAAEAMRRILVEAARREARQKGGGGLRRVDLADQPTPVPDDNFLDLDGALDRLASEDPIAAEVVELRQFSGLGHGDVVAAHGIIVYLARQRRTDSRAWLRNALGG